MRFGTGEKINITNLALPPQNREASPFTDPKDLRYLRELLSTDIIEEPETWYLLAMKLFFPDNFPPNDLFPDTNMWDHFKVTVAELESACHGEGNEWKGWDAYFEYRSILAMIDRESMFKKIPLHNANWLKIENRISVFDDRYQWDNILLCARCIALLDPTKLRHKWLKEGWSQGIDYVAGSRNYLTSAVDARRVVEMLANLRILFPEKFATIEPLSTEEQVQIHKTIEMIDRKTSPLHYFRSKINLAIATAKTVTMTDEGLSLILPNTTHTIEELPTVPIKRSF